MNEEHQTYGGWYPSRRLLAKILPVVGFSVLASPNLQAQTTDVSFTVFANSLILTSYPSSLSVYKNGLRLKEGLDYTHIGNQITFKNGAAVSKDDVYIVDIK